MPHPPVHEHEEKDIRARTVLIVASGLFLSVLGIALVVTLLFGFLERTRPEFESSPLAPARDIPPNPKLQVNPRMELQDVRAHENLLLHQYAWVDKDKGIVRIPIERAIDLIAQRGLPPTKPAPATGGQHAAAKQ
jgi:hypothetical protein